MKINSCNNCPFLSIEEFDEGFLYEIVVSCNLKALLKEDHIIAICNSRIEYSTPPDCPLKKKSYKFKFG